MPGRLPNGEKPRPFSSDWLSAEPLPEPQRTHPRLPAWVPDGRALSAGFMVAVTLGVALVGLQGSDRPANGAQTVSPIEAQSRIAVEAPVATAEPPAAAPTVANFAVQFTPETEITSEDLPASSSSTLPGEAAPSTGAVLTIPPASGFLLPDYRILAYYGHPHDPAMGIVGEHDIEKLAALLKDEAANYAAGDPTRPVIPALEIIATVAQRDPGVDGTYILDTSRETLTKYIDFAAANGMLVILDLQIGRGTVASEIEKVRDLLALPNVHLAIDPEFAVAEGQVPGEYIGSVTAESITYAQQVLAEISAANGIPPKLLIVHQFREDMIQNKNQLAPYPGVQLVIDADGYGAPELKTAVYNFLVRDEPVEFAGVKLFYRQDVPVMSPRDILALSPAPDVIIYQ